MTEDCIRTIEVVVKVAHLQQVSIDIPEETSTRSIPVAQTVNKRSSLLQRCNTKSMD